MRNRVVFALLVSVLFIGGATWMRAQNSPTPSPTLLRANSTSGSEDKRNIFERFLSSEEKDPEGESLLSNTDLVSRQLILDYIDLASKGEATVSSLSMLAEQYVEGVPELNQVTTVKASDIRSVKDSSSSFQDYENTVNAIHKNFADYMNKKGLNQNDLTVLSPEFYSFAGSLSLAYSEAANKLASMRVPTSIVYAHVRLINSYLSSAAAMKSLSETEKDPVVAFAGIASMNSNMAAEKAALAEISAIINRNGI